MPKGVFERKELSDSQKKKLANNFKKYKKWNYHNEWKKGKILSDEHKKSISLSHVGLKIKGNFSEWKKGRVGEESNRFINGIRSYRRIAKEYYEVWKCLDCSSSERLEVHHIDKDRTNNKVENLLILCKQCHESRHHKKV